MAIPQDGRVNGTEAIAVEPVPPNSEPTQWSSYSTNGHLSHGLRHLPEDKSHPENVVPRLGDFLIEMGVLEPEELAHALEVQQQRLRENQSLRLGQLLQELGYIDKDFLDHAVMLQVMELQRSLANQNQRLEQKVVERTRQLAEVLDRATRLQRHKDEFVDAISHELRTPLTVILGYLEMFRAGDLGQISSSQAVALDSMRHASDRLHCLISNLLFFADSSSDVPSASYERVPVSKLFRIALNNNAVDAEARGIQLLAGVPRPKTFVLAESNKIGWLLSELVENAVKFTDAGGQVRLIGRHQGDQRFQFLVVDTGAGIPPERMDEVFEPFRQLDGSTTRKAGGMGLGLTLARRIVEAHGSELEIRSQPGVGTQVSFSLPQVF